eukprot:8184012-Pyramimonas_sp.AAC.1
MFNGRVSPGSKKSPTPSSWPDGALGRNTIKLWLKPSSSEGPRKKSSSSSWAGPAAKCCSAANSTSVASGPRRRHALNGMPSGPGAESGAASTAL